LMSKPFVKLITFAIYMKISRVVGLKRRKINKN
jgi:hypothetical protein